MSPKDDDRVTVRRFRDTDAAAAAAVFFAAVTTGARGHYGAEQRRAWGGEAPHPDHWAARLAAAHAFVAEVDRRVVGFMTVAADGLIDVAFVSPSMMGRGVAWRLYRHCEAEARRLGATRLHADASHLARPFFERQGWRVVTAQTVTIRGVALTNFKMEKALDDLPS